MRELITSSTIRIPISSLEPNQPICVDTGVMASEAINVMRSKRIGCVLVVDGGRLAGIFTERDFLTRVLAKELDADGTPIEKVMTRAPEYLYKDDPVAFALNKMSVGNYRHIPLIDAGHRPVGLVSVKDIFHRLVSATSETSDQ